MPTSNICERLFSRAKLVLTDRRQNLTDDNFNALLFLHINRHLWDEVTVTKCTNKPGADDVSEVTIVQEPVELLRPRSPLRPERSSVSFETDSDDEVQVVSQAAAIDSQVTTDSQVTNAAQVDSAMDMEEI